MLCNNDGGIAHEYRVEMEESWVSGGDTKFSNKMVLNNNNLQRKGGGYKCSVLFAVFGIKYVLNFTKKKVLNMRWAKMQCSALLLNI